MKSPNRQNQGTLFYLNFPSRYTSLFTCLAAAFLRVRYKFAQAMTEIKKLLSVVQKSADSAINPLAPELFFLILAHPVYKM